MDALGLGEVGRKRKGEKQEGRKKKNNMEKVKRKKIRKEIKRKRKDSMEISLSYSTYIARRSCFAKCFPKTVSTPPRNPLH
jgi:hypothetical protein